MEVIKISVFIIMFFVYNEAKTQLPSGMTQHQYCSGCIATVKELQKVISRRHLTAGNRESKIMEIMDKICNAQMFVEYDYSPPKTEKACKVLLDNHEEALESALVKNKENVQQLICFDVSKACEGVDISKKQKKSKLADIDLTDAASKTVKVDPQTQKFTVEEDTKKMTKEKKIEENSGKTLSKKDKKKDKKKKTKKADGKQKGSINHVNVDINDPGSMERIMAQIKELTQQQANQQDEKKTKEEL